MQARIADRELSGLQVRVHYPVVADGPLPVVVFSHGLGGSRLGYGYLGKFLAEHGYVTVHPSHRENVPFGVTEAENPGAAALRAMKEAIDDPRNWEARPRDVATVIDALPHLSIAPLAGKLDTGRIAVAGHSYGAYTALLCAGARVFFADGVRDFSEPRARAFVALSPPGNGSRGLTADSWASVARPVLCVTGTLDLGMQRQPASWREESFRGMRRDKTLVVVAGAEHFTFSGGRPRRPAKPAAPARDRGVGALVPRPVPARPRARRSRPAPRARRARLR